MKKIDSDEVKRRWSLWVIVALGLIMFALPLSIEVKSIAGVVLYLLFLAIYMWFRKKRK